MLEIRVGVKLQESDERVWSSPRLRALTRIALTHTSVDTKGSFVAPEFHAKLCKLTESYAVFMPASAV